MCSLFIPALRKTNPALWKEERTKNRYFSERRSSALGPPISNWTTHEGPPDSQLNTLLSTPSSRSSVKATNCVEPNVEIVRRAEVHVQVEGQSTGKTPMTITACGSYQDQAKMIHAKIT